MFEFIKIKGTVVDNDYCKDMPNLNILQEMMSPIAMAQYLNKKRYVYIKIDVILLKNF